MKTRPLDILDITEFVTYDWQTSGSFIRVPRCVCLSLDCNGQQYISYLLKKPHSILFCADVVTDQIE